MGRTCGTQGAQETCTEFWKFLRYHLRDRVINKRMTCLGVIHCEDANWITLSEGRVQRLSMLITRIIIQIP
jgi:hypothetical protein